MGRRLLVLGALEAAGVGGLRADAGLVWAVQGTEDGTALYGVATVSYPTKQLVA